MLWLWQPSQLKMISRDASTSSWPGIAVRRTASLPLAYVPAIHVLRSRLQRRGCPGAGRALLGWDQAKLAEIAGQHPILVVVVQGDVSDGSPPTYQYRFAERAAAAMPDTVVAAVLRPGYSDGEDTSEGLRGFEIAVFEAWFGELFEENRGHLRDCAMMKQ